MEASGLTLAGRVERFCRREGFPLRPGCRVLCAVSGGIDSMALLHLLWMWSRRDGFLLTAATFDHRLRPRSVEDVQFVVRWCEKHQIPCEIGGGDVAAYAGARGLTVEEAARSLRYRFLEDAADRAGADYIATAHNADDNGETLLLHLLRGSGLNGLGGIPPRRGRIIRPLLEITRAEIEDYAGENDLPHREDETNRDTAYTRNYLRHRVMPLLREKNPNLVRTLSQPCQGPRPDGGEPAPGRGVSGRADGGAGRAAADERWGRSLRFRLPIDRPAGSGRPPAGAADGGGPSAGHRAAPEPAAGAAGPCRAGAALR